MVPRRRGARQSQPRDLAEGRTVPGNTVRGVGPVRRGPEERPPARSSAAAAAAPPRTNRPPAAPRSKPSMGKETPSEDAARGGRCRREPRAPSGRGLGLRQQARVAGARNRAEGPPPSPAVAQPAMPPNGFGHSRKRQTRADQPEMSHEKAPPPSLCADPRESAVSGHSPPADPAWTCRQNSCTSSTPGSERSAPLTAAHRDSPPRSSSTSPGQARVHEAEADRPAAPRRPARPREPAPQRSRPRRARHRP